MKSYEHICTLDSLGRILIPVSVRRKMELSKEEKMELYVDNNSIILRKPIPTCTLCGNKTELIEHNGKCICKSCLKELNTKAAR